MELLIAIKHEDAVWWLGTLQNQDKGAD